MSRIVLAVTADESLALMQGFPRFLSERGWEVHVVSSPGFHSDELRKTAQCAGVHTVRMTRSPSPAKDLAALFAWVRLLRALRPDVVMLGTPKAALLGMLAAWTTRVPDRVYLLRGLRLETTHGVVRAMLAAAERMIFAMSTRSLAVSASLAAEARRLNLAGRQRVEVLGLGSSNGVDLAKFRPRCDGADESRLRAALGLADLPTIGFVGRLAPDKGLAVLTRAIELMRAGGVRQQLLVVGGIDGSTGVDPGRLTTISTGYVSDPSPYYRLMDVLCLPTMREGFPNVVLEAAASGVPTVTTTATGAIDSVIDEKTGLIVESGNAESLAEALTRALSDDELRKRLGVQARMWVESNFSQEAVWERIEDFLARRQDRSSGGHRDAP